MISRVAQLRFKLALSPFDRPSPANSRSRSFSPTIVFSLPFFSASFAACLLYDAALAIQ